MTTREQRTTFLRCLDSQIDEQSRVVSVFKSRYNLSDADASKLVKELANEYNVKLTK